MRFVKVELRCCCAIEVCLPNSPAPTQMDSESPLAAPRSAHRQEAFASAAKVLYLQNSVEKQRVAARQKLFAEGAQQPPHAVAGRSLAILRRFWAVAARMNSSLAPF
ncbi:MAG: hypothetical protein AAGH68_10040, partial [Pseudomonadota bacterium]